MSDRFWEFPHGRRTTEWATLLGGIFLLLEGGERWSVDRRLPAAT
ncbi:hypothetical protein SAMN00120144_3310 [Hymenobacter roseosalivarius DSM 11622]|uniref:Uncharacterized protein n=1 Tax=Hymenobacter roseosalivarius DSM 11622 TaxID=645990 RepID=A0A1W1VI00_9BACT|nr:hypothetical protein [Hymenobacter roseosalivarius]SMB92850.1 hypothetical protein SAMN00120144_3310 [Hymenobacter roseosalivarius DSM 11622]